MVPFEFLKAMGSNNTEPTNMRVPCNVLGWLQLVMINKSSSSIKELTLEDDVVRFSFQHQSSLNIVRFPKPILDFPGNSSFENFTARIEEFIKRCNEEGLLLLYHYTDPKNLPSIKKYGFRMSHAGQGGGGVYFSTKGPLCYGFGNNPK